VELQLLRISAEKYISNFLKFLWVNQRGSASVEFVALAIPLFIPLFIFMNSFASASDSQDSLRTLAREAARGFVTSANDEIAFGVAHQIVTQGAIILGHEDAIARGEILMQIECSVRPCISPNAGIRVIMSKTEKNGSKITVSAIEYVSPWA
jgi:Flp pilus assembly protein TadG